MAVIVAVASVWAPVASSAQGGQAAQAQTPATVLIRNVTLIDREGDAEDLVVSILVRDGSLDIVTEDEIPADEAELAVDAQSGRLLGTLDLGQPPSFLILDGDPRENPDILLDTQTYARFAMRLGVIIRNRLPAVGQPTPEEAAAQRRSGWLAYTPPPLSLSVSYQNSRKWNRWQTKAVSGVFLAALMLDRHRWSAQDEPSEEQVGSLDEFDRGEVRGLRVGAVGTVNFERPWVYTFFAATRAYERGFDTTSANDITIYDYRLDIPLWNRTTLSVGKQKEPISMERIIGLVYQPFGERTSVSDSMLPSRNVGVVVNSTLPGERLSYAVGVFNDWFDAGERLDESSTQFVGRVTGLPFVSGEEGSLLHVGFGMRYTNAREGVRFQTRPEFNSAPVFVDTGFGTGVDTGSLNADRSIAYDIELSARRGPVWLASEYVRTNVIAPAHGNPTFSGYHVAASWIVTGEMRSYNRRSGVFNQLPITRPIRQGGWGAWEVATRWSDLDLSDAAIQGGELGTGRPP